MTPEELAAENARLVQQLDEICAVFHIKREETADIAGVLRKFLAESNITFLSSADMDALERMRDAEPTQYLIDAAKKYRNHFR